MSLRLLFELVLAVYLLTLAALTALAVYDRSRDGEADRRIQWLISDERACNELACQLEEIRNLPEREPWWRWAA